MTLSIKYHYAGYRKTECRIFYYYGKSNYAEYHYAKGHTFYCYAECRYVEVPIFYCCYAECCILIVILDNNMISVTILL